MVLMTACSLLLGRPWQWNRNMIHYGRDNIYSVLKDGEPIGLKPMPPKGMLVPTIGPSATSPSTPSSSKDIVDMPHVCLSSCRKEVLDVSNNKKERRAKQPHLRNSPHLDKGDMDFTGSTKVTYQPQVWRACV